MAAVTNLIEEVIVDVDSDYASTVTIDSLNQRKAEMVDMRTAGEPAKRV